MAALMAIAGVGLIVVGFLDRRDGLVIAGALLLGSILIADRDETGPVGKAGSTTGP